MTHTSCKSERQRRKAMLQALHQKAANDVAALRNFGEWLSETVNSAHMDQSVARAHGKRMLQVAKTLEVLIDQAEEARLSKWDTEDRARDLELQIAALKFNTRMINV